MSASSRPQSSPTTATTWSARDIDAAKIEGLRRGEIPIYEPGLSDLVLHNVDAGRLRFTTSNAEAAAHGDVIFLAVGTPTRAADGAADLTYLLQAAVAVAKASPGPPSSSTRAPCRSAPPSGSPA
jgi:UDP-glucose 6-dehydrogenase